MSMRKTSVALISLLAAACSGGGTSGHAVGTPEWLWDAARDTYQMRDFRKAEEHLSKIDEGERKLEAMVWRAVLLSGFGKAYRELSDAYSEGVEEAGSAAPTFHNRIREYRRRARSRLISLTEMLPALRKEVLAAEAAPLNFRFPPGTAVGSPLLESLREGTALPEGQQAEAERHTVQRGILLEAAAFAGAGEDTSKAQSLFEQLPVEIPTEKFLLRMAQSVVDHSALFDERRLNEPEIRKAMLSNAAGCLESALESEDEELKATAEKLMEEIEKEQRKIKILTA